MGIIVYLVHRYSGGVHDSMNARRMPCLVWPNWLTAEKTSNCKFCYQNIAHSLQSIYLLTQYSRVHLEKLTVSQLVKKLPALFFFYGTGRFITAFTSVRHLSLSWASSIHLKIIIPSTTGSSNWSLSLRNPSIRISYTRFYQPNNIIIDDKIIWEQIIGDRRHRDGNHGEE